LKSYCENFNDDFSYHNDALYTSQYFQLILDIDDHYRRAE